MKYGDPVATWRIAREVFEQLMDYEVLGSDEEIVLASSAFGAIPTASYWVTDFLGQLREQEGMKIDRMKFEREGGFGCHNYSQLGVEDRREVLGKRTIRLAGEVDLKGKSVVIFDDLRSTGAHEETLYQILSRHSEIKQVIFLYYVGFELGLARTQPQVEDVLNHSQVRNLQDLFQLAIQAPSGLLMNARMVKFFLKAAHDSPEEFKRSLDRFPNSFLIEVMQAARSRDGYADREPYRMGFQLLEQTLQVQVG